MTQQYGKVDRVQLGGKSRHGAAVCKNETWLSSVERVNIWQQHGKSRYSAAAWKNYAWGNSIEKKTKHRSVEKVDMVR